jgi:hypothetical protein
MVWKKGESGNPNGRTRGSGLRQLLTPYAPDLINKAVGLALGGNEAALRICLDRVLPIGRCGHFRLSPGK